MNAVALFQSKAPGIIAKLRGDFPELSALDCEAIVGNAGHESNGFSTLQEVAPTVKNSAGGWGWFQWTGPRRRAFEAYCTRNNLDPAGDQANYAWLFLELKGSEQAAIRKVTAAKTLTDKVVAFEEAYERAGVKNYPSRQQWAIKAKTAYEAAGSPVAGTPRTEQLVALRDETAATEARAGDAEAGAGASAAVGVGAGGLGASVVHHLGDWLLLGGFVALVVGAVIALVVAGRQQRSTAASLRAAAVSIAQGGK